MNEINWINAVPSIMSALASVGAAIAAFVSLRISREAKLVSEKSALAVHHGAAAMALANAVDTGKCQRSFRLIGFLKKKSRYSGGYPLQPEPALPTSYTLAHSQSWL